MVGLPARSRTAHSLIPPLGDSPLMTFWCGAALALGAGVVLIAGCGGISESDAESDLVEQHPHSTLSDVSCQKGSSDNSGQGPSGVIFRCHAKVNGRSKGFEMEETDSGELMQLP